MSRLKKNPYSFQDLRNGISQAVALVTPITPENLWVGIKHCLDFCVISAKTKVY